MRVSIGLVLLALAVAAGVCDETDWPHWRGPNRDGTTPAVLVPDGVSPVLRREWQAGVGEGCSSVVIGDGRLYTMGRRDGSEQIVCMDASSGHALWTRDYEAPRYSRRARGDQGYYAGPSATPELDVDAGLLFTLGIDGELACWDVSKDGEQVWRFNLNDRYDIRKRPDAGGGQRDYGFVTAPLVLGDALLVMVGAPDACVIAFDKRTGRAKWQSENRDPAGHAGGMSPMTVNGVSCVAALTLNRLVLIRTDAAGAGRTLAAYPWQTNFANNIVTPTPAGERVLLSSDYNLKKTVLLAVKGDVMEPVWESRAYSGVGSPVVAAERVFIPQRRMQCIDLASGRLSWAGRRTGNDGSCVVTADGYLVVFGNGSLCVFGPVERLAAGSREIARVQGLCRSGQAWPHVAVLSGRVYCRDRTGLLQCFATRAAD